MLSQRDYQQAGRLLHWGLTAGAFPGNEPEYAEALQRYADDGEFRDVVVYFALGLGLVIVDANEAGMVLAPSPDSLFRARVADYRSSAGADDRLLEGLIHVGIASTVFPRGEALEEATTRRRPPITVDEVEEVLRQLSERMALEHADEPDPAETDVDAGLIAAWRVYHKRISEDDGRRRVGTATKSLIRKTLDTLTDSGMFVRRQQQGRITFQPTFRYQSQVVEFSANAAFRSVRHLMARAAEAEGSHA